MKAEAAEAAKFDSLVERLDGAATVAEVAECTRDYEASFRRHIAPVQQQQQQEQSGPSSTSLDPAAAAADGEGAVAEAGAGAGADAAAAAAEVAEAGAAAAEVAATSTTPNNALFRKVETGEHWAQANVTSILL